MKYIDIIKNWVLYNHETKIYEVFIRNGAYTKSKFEQKSIAMCRGILWIVMGFFANKIKIFYYNKSVLLLMGSSRIRVIICSEIIKERFRFYRTSSDYLIGKIFTSNWSWYVIIIIKNFTFDYLFYRKVGINVLYKKYLNWLRIFKPWKCPTG